MALTIIGCQKDGNQAEVSPYYDPDTKQVTTQFVLNVATSPKTKQTATTVQQNNNFRGIQDAHIFVYQSGVSSGTPYVSTSATSPKEFELGVLYRSGDIVQENNKTSDSRRTLQLSIPVNTDAVLFYGKAITDGQGKETGYSGASYSGTLADTEIKVIKRMGETSEKYDATAHLMACVINKVMSISREAITVNDSNKSEYSDITGEYPAISWQELGAQYEYANGLYSNRFGLDATDVRPLTPLEEILGRVYSQFTFIKAGEYRSGSSQSIKWMMQDMHAVVKSVIDATPTNVGEANAERLAKAIDAEMNNYFTTDWDYKTLSELKTALGTSWITEYDSALSLSGYPYEDFGIPEGAAQLAFTISEGVGSFSYLHPNKALVSDLSGQTFDPYKYVYPAELFYYANSAIRTTDKSDLSDADFPDGTTPWNSSDLWNAWTTPGKVESSTRGVAIKDNINYGVSLLKTSIGYASGCTFEDNRKEITGEQEENQTFDLDDMDLSLKGVLIGGVTPRLNWQFLRKYVNENTYAVSDGVIYDDVIPSSGIPTTTGNEVYTLVYDNYDPTIEIGQSQPSVYVALELINNGDAFWGKHNLIRKGATFYLVSELKPADITNTLAWPTDHQIPPIYGVAYGSYDGTVTGDQVKGQSMQIPRVFIQDFMTTAVFTIGPTSLQRAYYSLPDLRSSQMSLGLSVDLSWEDGMHFQNTL